MYKCFNTSLYTYLIALACLCAFYVIKEFYMGCRYRDDCGVIY